MKGSCTILSAAIPLTRDLPGLLAHPSLKMTFYDALDYFYCTQFCSANCQFDAFYTSFSLLL